MSLTKIPPASTLVDDQFIIIEGVDQITTSYHYDSQTRSLIFKESQVIFPSHHGFTHIAQDPIPAATPDTPGLMSPDDKAKLDSLAGFRLGVLGFMGAGFPDDGGWMQGDVILAAGTEFISLERFGNVVRFTVDSPIPLNCACESCQQIFWVQDETDLAAIRPPTCSGKLPDVNAYGALKVFLMPESALVDPNNVANTLNTKGQFPALIFRRFDNTLAPGTGELQLTLKRDAVNQLQTEIGWAFTPGVTGVTECVWFTGKDSNGNQTSFQLNPESDPGLLGTLLYNGHLLSKRMGVITDYTSAILATNQYTCLFWDVDNHKAIGDTFTATNVWQYENPTNPLSGANPQSLIVDSSIGLLPIGTLVDIWWFEVGSINGEPIRRYYFSKQPVLNPANLWNWAGGVQFGDLIFAREEVQPGPGSAPTTSALQVSSIRDFEQSQWGLTGYDDPLLSFDVASTAGTAGADFTIEHRAIIDPSIPALRVTATPGEPSSYSERPVHLWLRRPMQNALLRLDIGRPPSDQLDSLLTPFDIIVRGEIDQHTNKYMRVLETGTLNGLHFVRVKGVHSHDLPPFGTIRILSSSVHPNPHKNMIFNYTRKFMFPSIMAHGTNPTVGSSEIPEEWDSIVLTGDRNQNIPYPGQAGDLVELLHQEYNSPIVRLEWAFNPTTGLVQVQFKVGTLDMRLPYEMDVVSSQIDDYVRGLSPGYAVSAVYSQSGTFTGVGAQPTSSPSNFVVYDGGAQIGGGAQDEFWNRLEIMVREGQVWIWWNQLLIPPSTTLSAQLPTPVAINTPYFQLPVNQDMPFGKVGLRMWPGAVLRRMDVRSQAFQFSEFTYGQLTIQ